MVQAQIDAAAGLRKLVEAKDCAVRQAVIDHQAGHRPEKGPSE